MVLIIYSIERAKILYEFTGNINIIKISNTSVEYAITTLLVVIKITYTFKKYYIFAINKLKNN